MSQPREISDLTICRAFFAAWVFVYHVGLYLNAPAWLGPLAGLVRHGYMGVDGFFILSGLILMHSHPEFRAPKMHAPLPEFRFPPLAAVLRFYAKRLGRIYPVHLATLLILAGLAAAGLAAGLSPRAPQRFGLGALLENLLLVQGWGGDHFGAWNYPSWSISTEWAGYLLFPFFALLITYWPAIVAMQFAVITFPILGFLYFFFGHSLNLAFSLGLLRFFPEFIAGIAAWRMAAMVADSPSWRGLFLWGGLLLLLAGAVVLGDLGIVAGLWSLLFALYLRADTGLPPLFGRRPLLHFLGELSYCFYMSFAIAELVTVQLFRHLGWQPAQETLLFAAGMTALTFGLALLLRFLVEQPCRRAVNRWLSPAAAPDAPDAPAPSTPSLF
ncbi:acyltransferase [Acidocella sp.]|uniref:acyltransferase family protein n=1 Tax=Acidocella sp. TaxID=50710 RepID=UPI00263943BD|nr:acyltransferase [Acidocella sp.]